MNRLFLIPTILIISILFNIKLLKSQTLTQTVRGKVYDSESQTTLPGANIVILGTTPLLGGISDIDGVFKVPNVPIGRYNIQIGFIGYDIITIPEVLITTGKEVVLNVQLKQSVSQLKEVTVNAYSKKYNTVNTMSSVSARSFTVEETRRYAGGMDDPARMASAFAGVTVGNLQDNAIIIRGNSPKGVSWRLEGVEIPNPNHFAGGNVAGGGFVTIFSSQMLSNSDFFTGAFPSEYGNALAGVFDMKLRNGNNEKREHTVQIGLMGIDVSSEGPLNQSNGASYLFNYRYSTLSLLAKTGIIPSEQIPNYQDLSFKLNFPTKSLGNFSLWGIGAKDNNIEPEENDSLKWNTDWDRIYYKWDLYTGACGLSHKYSINNQTYINSTLAASGVINQMDMKRIDNNLYLKPNNFLEDNSGRITLNTFINKRYSSKLNLKTGITFNELLYNLSLSSDNENSGNLKNYVKENDNSLFVEYYIQSKYELTKNLTLNAGLNANYFDLNKDYSIDPRISLKWKLFPNHSLSFGYGKHSQLEELKIYFVKNTINGESSYPNKNLSFSHAQHFILAYDWLINSNLRLKIEPYYQYLYEIPGIADSSFSMINFKQDWAFSNSLENNTIGKNIGIDFTLERFLNKNYYYLFTLSIFDSKYKADDGIWRNTRYNKGYSCNLLVGKEFFLKNNRILGVNGRLNYMGGERYSPILTDKSIQEKEVYYDETKAFEEQSPAVAYFDLTLTYRKNKKRFSSVLALQVKNIFGTPMSSGYEYNYKTNSLVNEKYVIIIPSLSYKVEF